MLAEFLTAAFVKEMLQLLLDCRTVDGGREMKDRMNFFLHFFVKRFEIINKYRLILHKC